MKAFIVIAAFIFGGFNLYSTEPIVPDYIKTDTETIFCKTLKRGFINFLIAKDSTGEKITFKKREVNSFKKDGIIYEKMPRIVNEQVTKRFDFMVFVSTYHNLKLYRQNVSSVDESDYIYHIFNGQQYIGTSNNENKAFMCEFITSREYLFN